MEDRELLDLAAKGAGIALHSREIDGSPLLLLGNGVAGRVWNPLADDGDALRLAVDLKMDIFVRAEWAEAVAPMGAPQKVWYSATIAWEVAVRRAIVLAAAATLLPKQAAVAWLTR